MLTWGVTVAHGWMASQQGCHGIHAVPWLSFPRDEAQGVTQTDMRKEKTLPG